MLNSYLKTLDFRCFSLDVIRAPSASLLSAALVTAIAAAVKAL